jgi:hypothetical protein
MVEPENGLMRESHPFAYKICRKKNKWILRAVFIRLWLVKNSNTMPLVHNKSICSISNAVCL